MSTNSSCHNIHHHRHSCCPFLITPKLWKLFSELKESWSDYTCQYEPPPHSWNPVVTSEIPSSIKHDPVTTGGKMRLKALGGQTDTNTWYQQQTIICTHGKIPPQMFFLKSPSNKKNRRKNVNPGLSDPLFAKPTKKTLNSKFLHVFYGSCSKVGSTNLLPVSKDQKWFHLEREESILILERGFQWLTVPRILP